MKCATKGSMAVHIIGRDEGAGGMLRCSNRRSDELVLGTHSLIVSPAERSGANHTLDRHLAPEFVIGHEMTPVLDSRLVAPRFTLADAVRAGDEWGFNCGPAAIAAMNGLTIEELRPHRSEERRVG